MDKKQYGKPIGDILKIKSDFFQHNEEMLEMSHRQADALLMQPKRERCKICHAPLPPEPLYNSQRMNYYLCPECGHVNSEYEDTDDFSRRVYLVDTYENNYSEEDRERYEGRLASIYIPKAEYLLKALKDGGLEAKDIRLLDDGAGSGYFVLAAKRLGIEASGIEISKAQVDFANFMAGEDILREADSSEAVNILRETGCNTVSFIGVMEHIINLDEVAEALSSNTNIKYVYLSVPMFSLSCVWEAAHQNCYNRHAGGTHTHLFTDESLAYLADAMGFECFRSWKFGSDMMDLYRMICVSLEQNNNSRLKDYFAERFTRMLDSLQLVADRAEFASEVHMVLRRKGE